MYVCWGNLSSFTYVTHRNKLVHSLRVDEVPLSRYCILYIFVVGPGPLSATFVWTRSQKKLSHSFVSHWCEIYVKQHRDVKFIVKVCSSTSAHWKRFSRSVLARRSHFLRSTPLLDGSALLRLCYTRRLFIVEGRVVPRPKVLWS